MTALEEMPLGELVEIEDSRRIPLNSTDRAERPGPYPYYGAAKIFDYIDDYIYEGDRILVGEDGSVVRPDGRPYVQHAAGRFWVNNHAHVLRPVDGVDFHFLKAALEIADIRGFVTGAAQPKLNQANLKRIPIPLPPKSSQRVMGGLLRGMERLIENNRRRIEILEETARLIYREWFVHFRFPCHEDVELIDSALGPIPEGWEVAAFADLADFVNGFAFKPSDHWMEEGLPIIKIKELKAGVAADTPRYHGEDIPEKYFIENGDLLFSWSADLDAYLWPGGPALLNQHLFVVRPHELSELFLFHSLSGRMGEFRARSQGTTMKHIKRSALSEVLTVVPDRVTRQPFEESVGPMLELQLNLTRQNRVLSEVRDLLVPRLISGELDVSGLDLDFAPVA